MKKKSKIVRNILLLIFIIFFLPYITFFGIRGFKINTIKELVYEESSPITGSILRIYQRGGDSVVWFVTPMEIECTSANGYHTERLDIKMGHMIKVPEVVWNLEEDGGELHIPKNGRIVFSCRNH